MLLCVPLWSAVNHRQVFSGAPINLSACPPMHMETELLQYSLLQMLISEGETETTTK